MAGTSDDNVYIKRGNKYIPFGRRFDETYLPDGIWYVHHDAHCCGTVNVDHYLNGLFKVGDSPKVVDIPKLCRMYTYTQYVLCHPEMKLLMSGKYTSANELVSKVVALVVNLNEEIKKRDDDNKKFKGDSPPFSR